MKKIEASFRLLLDYPRQIFEKHPVPHSSSLFRFPGCRNTRKAAVFPFYRITAAIRPSIPGLCRQFKTAWLAPLARDFKLFRRYLLAEERVPSAERGQLVQQAARDSASSHSPLKAIQSE